MPHLATPTQWCNIISKNQMMVSSSYYYWNYKFQIIHCDIIKNWRHNFQRVILFHFLETIAKILQRDKISLKESMYKISRFWLNIHVGVLVMSKKVLSIKNWHVAQNFYIAITRTIAIKTIFNFYNVEINYWNQWALSSVRS